MCWNSDIFLFKNNNHFEFDAGSVFQKDTLTGVFSSLGCIISHHVPCWMINKRNCIVKMKYFPTLFWLTWDLSFSTVGRLVVFIYLSFLGSPSKLKTSQFDTWARFILDVHTEKPWVFIFLIKNWYFLRATDCIMTV